MSNLALSFVLLERAEKPDPAVLVETASDLGYTVTPAGSAEDGPVTYEVEGGITLLVMLIEAPHPEATQMSSGLASPTPDELERMSAHYIVTALGLPEDPNVADPIMVALTAAVVRASSAIAAMLGHGVAFHKAAVFTETAQAAEGEIPMLVCVDLTLAPEPENRMSILTHGLARYGREEFYVTASQQGQGAIDFVLSLSEWMLRDREKHLPTGDTVGRSAEEQVEVQRVPNPTGEGDAVIRLDLDL